jgi:DNA-binding NarL/FixJ family response regulator
VNGLGEPQSGRSVVGEHLARGPAFGARTDSEQRRPITVVLVDDERMIRSALAQALKGAGLSLVGEATDGEDAIELVVDLRPDVVLADLRLPGISGVEMIEQLGLLAPASRVLVLTRTEENRIVEAIIAGASGYILKTAPPDTIIAAVRATAAGDCVLSPQVAGALLERIRERDIPVTAASHSAAGAIRATLTARELEIFTLLASGESNQQIGCHLALSANTVSNHIKSILAKLHLDNRIQAAVHAVRSGIS